MYFIKYCTLVALLFITLTHQTWAGCICGLGEGKDMCSNNPKCAPMVVRPAPLGKLNFEDISKPRVVCKQINVGLPPLKPVGDLCSCKQSIVVPANVPKPAQCSCKGSSSHQHHQPASWSVVPDQMPEYVVEGPTSAAVDPVSLALAMQAQNQACGATEAKLSYGFRKLPVDLVVEKPSRKLINEQGLNQYNGQVVELKRVACGGTPLNVDEEAMADLEAVAEDMELETPQQVKPIRYADVGFGLAKMPTVPFKEVVGVVEANPMPVQVAPTVCNDGYVPGNVIVKSSPYQGHFVSVKDNDSGEDYRSSYYVAAPPAPPAHKPCGGFF